MFSRIIAGTLPGFVVWQDQEFAALLDVHPVNPGHTLLVPKLEVSSPFELPSALYDGLWRTARKLEPGLRAFSNAPKIGVVVQGIRESHANCALRSETCDSSLT
jgi:histidine triad (HIT) family protein